MPTLTLSSIPSPVFSLLIVNLNCSRIAFQVGCLYLSLVFLASRGTLIWTMTSIRLPASTCPDWEGEQGDIFSLKGHGVALHPWVSITTMCSKIIYSAKEKQEQ
ncbi:hypothetical protein IHE45_12G068500 [Dioscorea alata]|uniref:Uncharacterized protein n=1 Tax=Dioscorea alata TaxID=55571 RepID=A0ACB7V2U4_DIOAL|nr:hypothetical protein IHE45_12G068500 [Dioscorea alata]